MSKDNLPLLLYAGTISDVGNGNSQNFNVEGYASVEVFIGTITMVGGASPTITIKGQAVDAQGNAYTQSTSAALAAGAGSNYAVAVGAATQTNKPIGRTFRVGYTVAGAPTSFNFYLEVIARP